MDINIQINWAISPRNNSYSSYVKVNVLENIPDVWKCLLYMITVDTDMKEQ